MESLGMYLLKSAVWLTGFALVFLMFLRNERYFRLNRIYLLSGIIASIAFPFYTWYYAVVLPSVQVALTTTADFSAVATVVPVSTPIAFYWWLYLAGMISIGIRLVWQTGMVVRKLRKTGYVKTGSVKLVRTTEYDGSFSFFSFVFVNPSIADIETKEIVNHEREHIQQRHWFDLLLVELLCMLQWFNPFVWIYARLIRQNHEYLADEMALQHTSNPAIYQATLLNQLFGAPLISLANSFSYSLNKKRFKMMKNNKHSPFRKLKMLLVLPLIAMVFYAFAKPEYVSLPTVTSNEKVTTITEALNELNTPLALPVDKAGKIVQDKQDKIVEGKVVNAVNENIRKEKNVVKGKVINPDGKALPGTSVILSGTTIGTITDKDGNFQLKDVPKNGEVVFSFVGYANAKVKADFEKPMLIELARENVGLDGVVVVGYGIVKKSTVLKVVDSKRTQQTVVGNGKTEDLKTPPSPLGYNIRTIDSKNPPLYVIDGVITDKRRAEYFLEVGVESVNVLKDKQATDKYGEKGKYGVLEITLKKSISVPPPPNDTKNPPLYVIDGVITDKRRAEYFLEVGVESVKVLKGKSATDKYGEKGKYGVLEMTLKKDVKDGATKDSLTQQGISLKANSVTINTNSEKSPLVFLDGVIIDKAKMDAINPNDIESITVLKDKSATEIYGQKGKNGVLLITSKKKGIQIKLADGIKTKPSLLGEAVSQEKNKEVFVVVEQMPEFPGGALALRKFIAQSVKYPVEAQKGGIVGEVFVTFVVNRNGKVENAKIAQGIDPGLDAEAIRVINSLPDWKPGQQHGEAVDVAYTMPIEFMLQ